MTDPAPSHRVGVRHLAVTGRTSSRCGALSSTARGHAAIGRSQILLHPYDHTALDVDELWGLPMRSDSAVAVKYFALSCLGDARRVEMALDAFIDDATGG
jgi:hypothetical protein